MLDQTIESDAKTQERLKLLKDSVNNIKDLGPAERRAARKINRQKRRTIRTVERQELRTDRVENRRERKEARTEGRQKTAEMQIAARIDWKLNRTRRQRRLLAQRESEGLLNSIAPAKAPSPRTTVHDPFAYPASTTFDRAPSTTQARTKPQGANDKNDKMETLPSLQECLEASLTELDQANVQQVRKVAEMLSIQLPDYPSQALVDTVNTQIKNMLKTGEAGAELLRGKIYPDLMKGPKRRADHLARLTEIQAKVDELSDTGVMTLVQIMNPDIPPKELAQKNVAKFRNRLKKYPLEHPERFSFDISKSAKKRLPSLPLKPISEPKLENPVGVVAAPDPEPAPNSTPDGATVENTAKKPDYSRLAALVGKLDK